MNLVRDLLDAYRWRVWPRRLVIGGLVIAAAVVALIPGPAPGAPPGATAAAVVAVRPLAAGHLLRADDLRAVRRPRATVPTGAVTRVRELAGRRLAGPVAGGEMLTPLRVLGRGLTAGLPTGTVALPLDVEAAADGVVRPGDRVDLYRPAAATPDPLGVGPVTTGPAVRVAAGVLVLAVLPTSADPATATERTGSAELVVAVAGDQVATLVTERANLLSPIVTSAP